MNPLSNHELGQATHREYEAKYGHRYMGEVTRQESPSPASRVKLVLAVSGSAAVAVLAAVSFLF
jgi:hypothetical protein